MLSMNSLRFSALASFVLSASVAFAQHAGQHDGSIDKFTTNLTSSGFAVAEGSMAQLDPTQLCCAGKIPYGMYFNKVTPYIGVKLPPIQGELPAFQIRPDEAVVLIGVTPPEVKYFAYQLYLGERVIPGNTQAYFAPHTFLLASVGDPANLRTLRTIGPDPFNRPVVLIFTPDQGTEARVRLALRSAGYPDAIINTVVVPANMLNLGMDPKVNDILLIIHRAAMFAQPNGAEDYINSFSSSNPPLRAFRVTPKTMGTLKPLPTAPLRVRGTGKTELDLAPGLEQLHQAILDRYQGYKATEYTTMPIAYEGYDFIQRGANALGDTRDALYLAVALPEFGSPENVTLNENEFLIAFGPKHVDTGRAIYSNLNVYAIDPQLPLGNVFFDKYESGTDYLPGADQYYVYKIKRHCNGEPFCMDLTAPPYHPCTPWCEKPPCEPFVLSENTRLGVIWRNYLQPDTNAGAAYSEALYDRLIKFTP